MITDSREYIIHICTQSDWKMARSKGEYRAASLETEGFIHCSRKEQVVGVVNRFYADVPDLVLLWIDPGVVEAEIRWEIADNDVFPHIFGALNIEAVVAVKDLAPDPDGVYRKIPGGIS